MNGTWKTGSYYGSMADGFTEIAPFGPKVSAKTKAAIAAKKKAIIAGTFYEFQGPIYDQAGKLRVPEGQEDDAWPDPLGRLARQGNRRQPEGLMDGMAVGAGATGAHPPRARPQP